MNRLLLSLSLLLVTSLSTLSSTPKDIVEGYENIEVVKTRMDSRPLHSIEGIWQLTGRDGGSIIAIERVPTEQQTSPPGGVTVTYRLIVITGSDITVRPGTIIGYATPAAKEGEYDASIYTGRSDDFTLMLHPKRHLLKLDASASRLIFCSTGLSLRFNWWRLLLPYLYRTLLSPLQSTRNADEGCLRIYPTPIPPLNPRYL